MTTQETVNPQCSVCASDGDDVFWHVDANDHPVGWFCDEHRPPCQQAETIRPFFVSDDRLGMIVRSDARGYYVRERERTYRGRTFDTFDNRDLWWGPERYDSREAAIDAYFTFAGYGATFAYYPYDEWSGDLDGGVCCAECAASRYREQGEQYFKNNEENSDHESDLTCDNCRRVIAPMTWCHECSSNDYLVSVSFDDRSDLYVGYERTHCARCQPEESDPRCQTCNAVLSVSELACDMTVCSACEEKEEEETMPRYHVMVSQPGCLPDYHSGDGQDPEGDDDNAMTIEEANIDRQFHVNDLLETLDDASVTYSDDRVSVITFGSYGAQRIVEIIEA